MDNEFGPMAVARDAVCPPPEGSELELGSLPDVEVCCEHSRSSLAATDHATSHDLGTNPVLPHTPLEEVLGVY